MEGRSKLLPELEGVKPLFSDDMIIYIYKTLKTPPKKKKKQLLELTTELSINAGYKINIQKSAVFLHTNNEREIKNDPSRNHIKTIKYLGTTSTTEVKDLYSENSKALMKQI